MPSSSKIFISCVPPVDIMMLGAPGGGGRLPSTSAFNKNTPPSMTMHCSAAGSPWSTLLPVGYALLLLSDQLRQQVVARAGRIGVAVGPDGGSRIIWKQRPLKLITI